MAALTKSKDDQVRTSKSVTFSWLEIPVNGHKNFQGIPCNNNGVFYPRQNHCHYHPLHCHLFLDSLLPIMNENLNLVRTVFEQNFPLKENIIDSLEKYIDELPFPHRLRVITNDKEEYFLEQPNEIVRTACKCMSRLSVALAAADNVKERLTNIICNMYTSIKIESIIKTINSNAHTALHIDHRDVGVGGKLLGKDPTFSLE